MWSIAACVCAGYGFVVARVCADMVYCNTCVCWHGSEQHKGLLTRSASWHKWVSYRYSVLPRLPLVTQNTA